MAAAAAGCTVGARSAVKHVAAAIVYLAAVRTVVCASQWFTGVVSADVWHASTTTALVFVTGSTVQRSAAAVGNRTAGCIVICTAQWLATTLVQYAARSTA